MAYFPRTIVVEMAPPLNSSQLATDRTSCSAKARSTSSCKSAVSWTRKANAVGDVRSRGLFSLTGTTP